MPNHCINMVEFADAASCAAARGIMDTDDGGFDFGAIRPMPACVKETAGYFGPGCHWKDDDVCVALALLGGRDSVAADEAKTMIAPYRSVVAGWGAHAWEAERVLDRAEELMASGVDPASADERDLRHGRAYLECIATTDSDGWYKWSCDNLGTKWNSYAVEWHETGVLFTTAWGPVDPGVVEGLVARVGAPALWRFSEEQFDYICGEAALTPRADGSVGTVGGCLAPGSMEAYKVAASIWDPDGDLYAWDPVGQRTVYLEEWEAGHAGGRPRFQQVDLWDTAPSLAFAAARDAYAAARAGQEK